jgi:hypothetical protein
MPLSAPAERELLHRRDIELRGYERADGLFDIEARLTDTKTYGFVNEDRGRIEPGEPLHGMWLRLTLDQEMRITACEAASDHTPYAICPQAAPNFARLAGITIGPGFGRAVKERVGGVLGCTHLRELLSQMATVAYQTLYPIRRHRAEEARRAALAAGREPPPATGAGTPVNSCLAYASDSPVMRRRALGGQVEPEVARP